MSKSSEHHDFLPPQGPCGLGAPGQQPGAGAQTKARVAARLGVSVSTLTRLEKGDPGVGMGVYAAALWLLGRAQALPDLADPALDQGALLLNIREAQSRSRPRKATPA